MPSGSSARSRVKLDRSQQIPAPAVVGVGIPVRHHHRRAVVGEHACKGTEGGARIGLHAVPQQDGGLRRVAVDIGETSRGILHCPHRTSMPGWPYRGRVVRMRDTDACPGALQVHQAADGALARIRLPGGMITAAQLAALAGVSSRVRLGDAGADRARQRAGARDHRRDGGRPRRSPPPGCCRRRRTSGSATSSRRRCPAGSAGIVDVRPWVAELDAAICAEPALVELGGRFWFSLDDGRADVSGLGADVGVHAFDDGCALLLAGRDTGVRLAPATWSTTLVGVATRFLRDAWKSLADKRIGRHSRACCPAPNSVTRRFPRSPGRRWAGSPVGWLGQTTAASRWAPRCRWGCCPHASRSTWRRSRPRW